MRARASLFVLTTWIAASCLGCSTTGKPEAQPAEVAEAPASYSPGAFFPFTLQLEGTEQGDEVEITLTVHYRHALEGRPTLTIDPAGDTEVVGIPIVSRLPTPTAEGDYVKTFRLRGTVPAIRATIQFESDGLAVEMHESYPPEVQRYRNEDEHLAPLPAPIEVEGEILDMGVHVEP